MKIQPNCRGIFYVSIFVVFFCLCSSKNAYADLYDPIPPAPACCTSSTTSYISMWYGYSLTATATYTSGTIYDDKNWGEYFPSDPDEYFWDCQRQWLLSGYTSPDDATDLVIGALYGTVTNFDVYIYKDPAYGTPVAS